MVRSEIRFILNGEDVSLEDVRPTETLLDFLRLRRFEKQIASSETPTDPNVGVGA